MKWLFDTRNSRTYPRDSHHVSDCSPGKCEKNATNEAIRIRTVSKDSVLMVPVDWPTRLNPAYVQGNLESPVTRSIYKLAPFPLTRPFVRLFEREASLFWREIRVTPFARALSLLPLFNTLDARRDNVDKRDRKESDLLLGSVETGRAGGNLEKDRAWLSTGRSKFWTDPRLDISPRAPFSHARVTTSCV